MNVISFLAGFAIGAIGVVVVSLIRSTQGDGPQTGRFILIIKDTDGRDYDFQVDVSNVKNKAGHVITDPAVLDLMVEVHESSDPTIVEVTSTPGLGKGRVHPTGSVGQATQTAKVYANQAALDRGDNPLVLATEVWDVQPDSTPASAEAKFSFTPVAPPA